MTLSTPVKLLALVAAAAVLAGGGFLMVYTHQPPAVIPVAAPVHHAPVKTPRVSAPASPASSLPAPLRQALKQHQVVVAAVYAPHAPGDDSSVAAARQGAHDAHVGFAALDVRDEATAKALAVKLPGSSDPSVVVVRRPADIVVLLPGLADRAVIAQAARNAVR